jgi:drug/metabolite transporter (DMT)-like permease
MNAPKWLGLAIAFCGMIPVIAMQSGSEELLNAFAFFSWPSLAIAGAALFSAYGWVLLRIAVKDDDTSPLVANSLSMLLGGTLAFAHSFFIETWAPTPIASGAFLPFLKGVAIIILISNVICYNLYGMALKRFTATFLSFVGLLSPIFATFNEWLLIGTTPQWTIFASTAVVCSGLFLVYRAELKQGYIVKESKPVPEPTN